MSRQFYTEEFKRDAVAMYENNPHLPLTKVADEQGVNRNSLKAWVGRFGTGARAKKTSTKQAETIISAEKFRKIERELAKVTEERDILRKACKYFAEETNW